MSEDYFTTFLDPRVKNDWEIQTVENLKDIIIYNNNCFFLLQRVIEGL